MNEVSSRAGYPRRMPLSPALRGGILAVAWVLGSGETASSQTPRPFTPRDLWEMDRISDAQVSPDGKWIVFGVSSMDWTAYRRRSDLWIVGSDGKDPRPLTSHPAADYNPRWAPDGTSVFFLSTRSGSSQVWRISVQGGEAQQVTRLPLEVGSLAVSPDGRLLVVSLRVFPDCPDLECSVAKAGQSEGRRASGVAYDRLFVRHWDTWKDGRRSHLFVVPSSGEGSAVDLMAGMDADAPSLPFGGPEEFTFTPDSRAVVFTTKVAGPQEAWSTDFDLYLAPVDGSRPAQRLTTRNRAWDTQPLFSPDGKTLAYLAMERPGYEADRFRVVLRAWPTDQERVLTQDWDRSVGSMAFSPDGRTLLVTAQNLGNTSLFSVDVGTGEVREIRREGTVRYPAYAGERIVFGLDHFTSPVELYSARPDGSDLRPLTRLNEGRLRGLAFGRAEQMTFAGAGGQTVYAWVLQPALFQEGRRYPVAFIIHGGPQGSSSNTFHYRWNPQVFAGAGYAVVMVDFHGSTGYGQAFTDAIRQDWGGKPLEDLKKGLAAALARYPWMDGSRACALGASYGGYMINWIAGQWPEGFRCLVNHDGVFDQRMMYFATEELWFPEWEHGGPYWEVPAEFEKHNPALHVDRWQTPMLVIHGGLDFRVPLEQGLATFTALQRRGIPSRFLYFPDENHWVLSPANSLLWHEEVLAWLARWTSPEGS